MKKELYVFLGIFLFLAIGMHFKQWTSYPVDHLMALPTASSYGLGWEHPLVYTTVVYVLVMIIRLPFRKKNKEES